MVVLFKKCQLFLLWGKSSTCAQKPPLLLRCSTKKWSLNSPNWVKTTTHTMHSISFHRIRVRPPFSAISFSSGWWIKTGADIGVNVGCSCLEKQGCSILLCTQGAYLPCFSVWVTLITKHDSNLHKFTDHVRSNATTWLRFYDGVTGWNGTANVLLLLTTWSRKWCHRRYTVGDSPMAGCVGDWANRPWKSSTADTGIFWWVTSCKDTNSAVMISSSLSAH